MNSIERDFHKFYDPPNSKRSENIQTTNDTVTVDFKRTIFHKLDEGNNPRKKKKKKERSFCSYDDTAFVWIIQYYIVHPTSCRIPSKGIESPLPKIGLDLFFMEAACEAMPIGESGLPVEVKQLSIEQSPICAGILQVGLISTDALNEGIFIVSSGAMPWHSLDTLIANSESSSLAASSPAVATDWSFRALHAFSRIDCRYFPCASMRSWRRRWTCW